jgi:WD40 repeat protein
MTKGKRTVKSQLRIFLLVLFFAALACNLPTDEPLPTLAPTQAIQPTHPAPPLNPTVTPPPTEQPSPVAQPTLAPTAAQARTPEAASAVSLVIRTSDGIWIVNSNGTKVTQLVKDNVIAPGDFKAAVSPRGEYVAYITSSDLQQWKNLTLKLLRTSDGAIKTITPLTVKTTDPTLIPPDDPAFDASRAIIDIKSVAWSPDGKQLAFISAHDGVSADLYLYSVENNSIKRLTDGPSHAFRPVWSPDGKFIIQMGAKRFGTGAGYSMAGAWAASADGKEVRTLYEPKSGDEVVIGWTANEKMAVYSFTASCGYFLLRAFNINEQLTDMFWKECFTDAAMDNTTGGAILISVDDVTASFNADKQKGLFLVPPRSTRAQKISDEFGLIEWSPEGKVFFVYTPSKTLAVTPNGEVATLNTAPTTARAAVSPDGKLIAWRATQKNPGVYIGALNETPKQSFDKPTSWIGWVNPTTLFSFSGDLYMYYDASRYSVIKVTEKIRVRKRILWW